MRAHVVENLVGLVEVLHEVYHLHVHLALHRVVGQDAGKEELLIVRVGGDEHYVRSFVHGLPFLHPGRFLSGEGVYIGYLRAFCKAEHYLLGVLSEELRNVRENMEKALALAFRGLSGLGGCDGPGLFRYLVEFDVNGA